MMIVYRIHRGTLRSHQDSLLYFLRHSVRDHDKVSPVFAAVKQWCLEQAVDHHFEARPLIDTPYPSRGEFYTALVLNNPADAVALRLRFGHRPGNSVLYEATDRLQREETWTVA